MPPRPNTLYQKHRQPCAAGVFCVIHFVAEAFFPRSTCISSRLTNIRAAPRYAWGLRRSPARKKAIMAENNGSSVKISATRDGELRLPFLIHLSFVLRLPNNGRSILNRGIQEAVLYLCFGQKSIHLPETPTFPQILPPVPSKVTEEVLYR